MNEKQFEIIAHTLGINAYHAKLSTRKKDKILPDEFYRNYFCAGTEKHHEYDILLELEKLGYMERWKSFSNLYFGVTDEGIKAFRQQFKETITDKFKPLSKAKNKYQDYLDSECCETFDEWLGIKIPKYEYFRDLDFFDQERCSNNGDCDYVRMISTKYDCVKGVFCPNEKLAKASYKKELREYLKNKRNEPL